MARNAVLAILMAVILAVVAFTVISAMGQRPAEADSPQAEKTQLELDMSTVRQLVQQQVDKATANLKAPAPQPPQPEPEPPHIARQPLDGQDIADMLNVRMWKYTFKLPAGQYTNYVWMERWTRDAEKPDVTLLSQTPGEWDTGELVVKLPSESHPGLFVRVNELMSRNGSMTSLNLPAPVRMESLKRQTLDPSTGQDIYLVTFTHNESGTSIGGRVDVHRDHDETIYIKTRFMPGGFKPFQRVPSSDSGQDNGGGTNANGGA